MLQGRSKFVWQQLYTLTDSHMLAPVLFVCRSLPAKVAMLLCRQFALTKGSLFSTVGMQGDCSVCQCRDSEFKLSWAHPHFLLWVPACIKCEVAVAILKATS